MSREDDARRLADVYSAHAVGYAEGWSPVMRPAGQRVLAAMPVRAARRLVDIGTGPGAHLADMRALAPAACVVGVDRAPGMLALARRHAVPVVVMDGMELALRSESIDVALMAFMLFHLPDPVVALAEARRVLRPGGSVGVTTWIDDRDPSATDVFEAELDAAGAVDPTPIPPRCDDVMNTPDKLGTLFAAAGLETVRVWTETIEHTFEPAALWALRIGYGRTGRKADSLDAAKRTAVLARIRTRWDALPPEAFVYRSDVACGIARRAVA